MTIAYTRSCTTLKISMKLNLGNIRSLFNKNLIFSDLSRYRELQSTRNQTDFYPNRLVIK